MTYDTRFETRHLPPDLQELVDTIINGVVALASRVNSNSDSNSLGGTNFCISEETPIPLPNTPALWGPWGYCRAGVNIAAVVERRKPETT